MYLDVRNKICKLMNFCTLKVVGCNWTWFFIFSGKRLVFIQTQRNIKFMKSERAEIFHDVVVITVKASIKLAY